MNIEDKKFYSALGIYGREHPDYFNRVKEYDKERYTRKIINWYMAEMVDNPDINLLYHLAEVDFNDDDQIIEEYRERFEE